MLAIAEVGIGMDVVMRKRILLPLGVYCVPLGLQLGLAIRCQKKPRPPQPTPKNAHGSRPWGESNKAMNNDTMY